MNNKHAGAHPTTRAYLPARSLLHTREPRQWAARLNPQSRWMGARGEARPSFGITPCSWFAWAVTPTWPHVWSVNRNSLQLLILTALHPPDESDLLALVQRDLPHLITFCIRPIDPGGIISGANDDYTCLTYHRTFPTLRICSTRSGGTAGAEHHPGIKGQLQQHFHHGTVLDRTEG